MKKILLAITMVASALAANAEQPVKLGNFTDNWYVGIGGGAATSLRFKQVFPLNGTVTVFLGKQITPVVGLEIEGTAWLGSSAYDPNSQSRYHFNTGANGSYKTIVRGHYVGLNGTFNLSNLFAGYKGAPRPFEVGLVNLRLTQSVFNLLLTGMYLQKVLTLSHVLASLSSSSQQLMFTISVTHRASTTSLHVTRSTLRTNSMVV